MKLGKSADKLESYNKRLELGEAIKIKPGHVDRIIRKLEDKKQKVRKELDESPKPQKKERLQRKLKTIDEQIERAKWLAQTLQTALDAAPDVKEEIPEQAP